MLQNGKNVNLCLSHLLNKEIAKKLLIINYMLSLTLVSYFIPVCDVYLFFGDSVLALCS